MNDFASFKKKVGIGALILVVLHILLAVSTILSPKQSLKLNVVASIYNQLILLGPFFQESRIKASPRLYVSYNKKGVWSSYRNYGEENFLSYQGNMWNYYRLHLSDYERYISNQIGSQKNTNDFEHVKNSRAFRELNQYVIREILEEPVDSVRLLYGVNSYLPESKISRFDTIFSYRYNLNQIAASKR